MWQVHTIAASFNVCVENVNSGPHASTASILPTELPPSAPAQPQPQPQVDTLFHNLCPALSEALNLFVNTFFKPVTSTVSKIQQLLQAHKFD